MLALPPRGTVDCVRISFWEKIARPRRAVTVKMNSYTRHLCVHIRMMSNGCSMRKGRHDAVINSVWDERISAADVG